MVCQFCIVYHVVFEVSVCVVSVLCLSYENRANLEHTHTHTSLFGQYAATFAGVSMGTAYAVYSATRRPHNYATAAAIPNKRNGIGVMLVAGAGGSLLDLAIGWNVSCTSEVEDWRRYQELVLQNKKKEKQRQALLETQNNGK
jgi:hypothetical protein